MSWLCTHPLFGRHVILWLRQMLPAACKRCLFVVRLPRDRFDRFAVDGKCERCSTDRRLRLAVRGLLEVRKV